MSAPATAERRRGRVGAAMILGTGISIQASAALAHGLFDQLTTTGTALLRFTLAATILLLFVRPSVRGITRGTWAILGCYGLGIAANNATFYAAISRIPLGITVTLAFIAPLAVSLARSRHRRDVLLAVLAGLGVAVLGGLDRPDSTAGVLLALVCGVTWVALIFLGRMLGARTRRVDGLALALPIAAVCTWPAGVEHLGQIDARAVALGLVIAVVGMILPFTLEIEGLRRIDPRMYAVIAAMEPAIAALVGLVMLDQGLSAVQVVGMGAVMAASAGAALAEP